MIIQKLV